MARPSREAVVPGPTSDRAILVARDRTAAPVPRTGRAKTNRVLRATPRLGLDRALDPMTATRVRDARATQDLEPAKDLAPTNARVMLEAPLDPMTATRARDVRATQDLEPAKDLAPTNARVMLEAPLRDATATRVLGRLATPVLAPTNARVMLAE